MYLTPDRFRSMGFGFDLAEFEDVELRSMISRASAIVDAYCAVPMLPAKHDFRGGTISAEKIPWYLGDPYNPSTQARGSRRVYPKHRPLREITEFRVMFTTNYSVTIDPSNLYVNPDQGWAEVVSLAAVVSGIYPVGVNFGLYEPIAEVSYTYGWRFGVAGERLEPTDAYTYRAVNGFWVDDPASVVYVNGVEETSGFTIDLDEGTVVFDAAQAAEDIVVADYTHKLPSAIAEATGIVAAHLLGERDLQAKGMSGVAVLSVAEVEIRRSAPGSVRTNIQEVEPEVAILLAPYTYMTIR